MDKQTLMAVIEFSRARLLATLDAIEKSGQDTSRVLAWRPGPGRAHIGWQAAHCAATHDRYLNVGLLQNPAGADEKLSADFGGGSKPSDTNVPTLADIRKLLAAKIEPLKQFIGDQTPESISRELPGPGGRMRSIGESIILLAWHEAHHQGQIHLTWNLYKAAHGVV